MAQSDILSQLRSLDPIILSPTTRFEITRFLHDAEVYLAQASSLLSPIHRIPTELLTKIFTFAGEEGRETNTFGVYRKQESVAFRISAVCHRWRVVALDTPELWSRFAVSLNRRFASPVKLFLGRSRQKPLSIIIEGAAEDDLDLSLLRSIVDHAPRWQSVDYEGLASSDFYDALDIISEGPALPLLRSIVCGSGVPEEEDEDKLKACKALDNVIIRYRDFYSADIESMPLGRVQHLAFEYGMERSFDIFLDMLRTCSSTPKSLSYRSPPNYWESFRDYDIARHTPQTDSNRRAPITCKAVSLLDICLYNDDGIYPHISDILPSLTLPALERLSISSAFYGQCELFKGKWPSHALDDFFARSRCVLTELLIGGLPLSETEVMAALRHTPSLRRLTIHEVRTEDFFGDESYERQPPVSTVTKSFVTKFKLDLGNRTKKSPRPQPFLPKLCFLELHVDAHFDADVEFVEMIQSRWYPAVGTSQKHSSLQTATLDVRGRELDTSVYEPLKALDKDGMQIVVKARGKGTLFERTTGSIPVDKYNTEEKSDRYLYYSLKSKPSCSDEELLELLESPPHRLKHV
ncbi:hypothetical protein V5O48_006138 [Marasmius crinis-equi]|uniref:F-box domain-containing protein n=1 Tax=Marasmius crinis-equi TaxID=585013 RepID=A0ABR3FKU4_9AGAR